MLALARVLLHEPELLVIDELSLGLAPAVVEQLLAATERLAERGQTMIVVEQSLNVAAAPRGPGGVHGEGPHPVRGSHNGVARARHLARRCSSAPRRLNSVCAAGHSSCSTAS